jgi:hypothetical protein
MAELARVFGQMEAAAASDPIEAGVREAGARGAARPLRWRSEDKGYGRIVGLCLRFYRAQGWPPTDHPKAVDIGHLLAKEKGEVPGQDDAQRVFAVLRSAKRRTGRRHLFSEAQEDARASYEAEQRPA